MLEYIKETDDWLVFSSQPDLNNDYRSPELCRLKFKYCNGKQNISQTHLLYLAKMTRQKYKYSV